MAFTKAYLCDFPDCDRRAVTKCPLCDTDACQSHGDFALTIVLGVTTGPVLASPLMPLPPLDATSIEVPVAARDQNLTLEHIQFGERRLCETCHGILTVDPVDKNAPQWLFSDVLREAMKGAVEAYRAALAEKDLE